MAELIHAWRLSKGMETQLVQKDAPVCKNPTAINNDYLPPNPLHPQWRQSCAVVGGVSAHG